MGRFYVTVIKSGVITFDDTLLANGADLLAPLKIILDGVGQVVGSTTPPVSAQIAAALAARTTAAPSVTSVWTDPNAHPNLALGMFNQSGGLMPFSIDRAIIGLSASVGVNGTTKALFSNLDMLNLTPDVAGANQSQQQYMFPFATKPVGGLLGLFSGYSVNQPPLESFIGTDGTIQVREILRTTELGGRAPGVSMIVNKPFANGGQIYSVAPIFSFDSAMWSEAVLGDLVTQMSNDLMLNFQISMNFVLDVNVPTNPNGSIQPFGIGSAITLRGLAGAPIASTPIETASGSGILMDSLITATEPDPGTGAGIIALNVLSGNQIAAHFALSQYNYTSTLGGPPNFVFTSNLVAASLVPIPAGGFQ